MISVQDIAKKRDEIFLSTPNLNEGLRDFLQWLTDNDSQLDEAAKKYVDQMYDNLFKMAENNASAMEESPEKRKALRLAKSGQGKHHSAKQLLASLEAPPIEPDQILKDWSEVVLKTKQIILDLMFDVVQVKQQGNFRVVTITLFYSCIDELTAAHALARHGYIAQANAHLRNVVETLDKIELFAKDSKWVEVWSSDDEKRIWNELRPSKVRKKLGKESEDPLYSHLSADGAHPTFRSFQGRAVHRTDESGTKIAHIFVAGTKIEHVRMFHMAITLTVHNLVISRLLACYAAHLNEAEVIAFLEEGISSFKRFHQSHFLPWAKENDLGADELVQALNTFEFGKDIEA